MATSRLAIKTTGHDEWLTPKVITDGLGPFDLDPCSPVNRPWDTASLHYNVNDDGLSKEWKGFVWMNPPYGNETPKWLKKLSEHGDGIALIFARTETNMWFDYVWEKAESVVFLRRRIRFCRVNGVPSENSAAPSALVAYGQHADSRLIDGLETGCINGKYIKL